MLDHMRLVIAQALLEDLQGLLQLIDLRVVGGHAFALSHLEQALEQAASLFKEHEDIFCAVPLRFERTARKGLPALLRNLVSVWCVVCGVWFLLCVLWCCGVVVLWCCVVVLWCCGVVVV